MIFVSLNYHGQSYLIDGAEILHHFGDEFLDLIEYCTCCFENMTCIELYLTELCKIETNERIYEKAIAISLMETAIDCLLYVIYMS